MENFEGPVHKTKDFTGACLGNGAIFPHVGEPNTFTLQ